VGAPTASGSTSGRPDGKSADHWALARIAIALEDVKPQMLRPITSESSEPIDAWVNYGEFPTLTYQGEQHAPVKGPIDPDQ
jgi:hypothetical protein